MTTATTSKAALERFETIWQDALEQEREAGGVPEPPPREPLPPELMPQEIAARLERLAGRLLEAGLLSEEQHARARDCAREQREIFASIDPARLEAVLTDETTARRVRGR